MPNGGRRTIRELLVRLGVDADEKTVDNFDRSLSTVKSTALGVVRTLAAVTAATIVVGAGFVDLARRTAIAGDQAAKAATRMRLTAEEVQELDFALRQSGGSIDTFEKGIRRIAKNARDAERGLSTAVASFKDANVEFRDAEGNLRPPLELLEDFADEIIKVEDESQQLALAQELLGRSGADLLPFLLQGKDGIRALRQEARDLGFVMSEEAAKASEEFLDNMEKVSDIVTGLRQRVGAELIPVLNEAIVRFVDWFRANKDIIAQRVDRFADTVRLAFENLLRTLMRVNTFIERRVGGWARVFRLVAAAATVLAGIRAWSALVSAIRAIGAALFIVQTIGIVAFGQIALAVIAAVAVFALLVLAVEDFFVFLQGGDSVLGAFLDRLGRTDQVGQRLALLFTSLADVGDRLLGSVTRLGQALSRLFGPALDAILPPLEKLLFLIAELEVDRQVDRIDDWVSALEFLALVLDKVTAAIDRFVTKAGGAGEIMTGLELATQQVLGFEPGSIAGEAATGFLGGGLTGAIGAAGTAAFAPTEVPGRGAGGTTITQVIEGDEVNISGAGMEPEEIEAMMERLRRDKLRQASAAFEGGEA